MDISVVGMGYAGLPHAAVLSKYYNVFAIDKRRDVVDLVNNGISPISEPGLEELLKNDTLMATNNLEHAIKNSDVSFICVGTPSNEDGSVDLSYVMTAAKEIGIALSKSSNYHVVALKSTVPPKTTREVVMPIVLDNAKRKNIGFSMNPEFLREGFAVFDTINPDRIVVGVESEQTGEFMRRLYSQVYNKDIEVVSLETAEMSKYASNSFLALKISYANEIANLCEEIGYDIDAREVLRLMALDNRINPKFLGPSRGFGGSCFPKDVRGIIRFAQDEGYEPKVLKSILEVNNTQHLKMIGLLENVLGDDLEDYKIAILGIAFKNGTDDIRESKAIPIINELVERKARVVAYDSLALNAAKSVLPSSIEYAESALDAIADADAVLVLNKTEEFSSLTHDEFVFRMNRPVVIDGESVYSAGIFKNTPVIYRSIGLGNYKKA